jgi:hypothetical protein
MDKKIIKDHLIKRFLSEEVTPGISTANKIKKDNAKINKDGVKDEAKNSLDYNKSLKQDKDTSKMAPNKYSYDDKFEKTYHDEMEIMNGQEMLQYDSKPDARFTERALEAIEGSAKMGNQGGIGNAQATWGASSDDFGKNLVKRIKASTEKRSEETPTLNLRGRDIQADLKDTGHRPYAIEENNKPTKNLEINNNNNPQIKESMKRLKFKSEFNGVGNALKLIPEGYKVDKKVFEMTDGNETYRIRWEGNLSEGKAVVLTASDKKLVNEDINRMKELFGYKSQETLGLVKGNARINENKVFGDIWNKSKQLLGESEEIESANATEGDLDTAVSHAAEAKKHVEGSVSTDKGTQAPKAKEGDASKAVSQAAEAKKHVEGSASAEKGTKAPAPKQGHWEDNVKGQAAEAKKHVKMNENYREGVYGNFNEWKNSFPKGTNFEQKNNYVVAIDSTGKELGKWNPVSIKGMHADDFQYKNLEEEDLMKEIEEDMKNMSINEFGDGSNYAPGTENDPNSPWNQDDEEGDGEEEEDDKESDDEEDDNWNKPEADDDSSDEKEPTVSDIKKTGIPIGTDDSDEEDDIVVPTVAKSNVRLLQSPSTGEYWIDNNGVKSKVPDMYINIASDKSKKGAQKAAIIIKKMEADAEYDDDTYEKTDFGLDEYAETHQDPETGETHHTAKSMKK